MGAEAQRHNIGKNGSRVLIWPDGGVTVSDINNQIVSLERAEVEDFIGVYREVMTGEGQEGEAAPEAAGTADLPGVQSTEEGA